MIPTEKALDKAARLTIGRVEQGTCYACGVRPVDPKRRITCGPCYDEADARSRAEVAAEMAAIAAEKGATK